MEPGYCYKYLKHFAVFNSWLALPFFVNWQLFPSKHVIITRAAIVYQYITECLEVLGFISCLLAPPQVWDNIDALCGCLSSLTHSCHIVLKTVFLRLHAKTYVLHFEKLELILKRNEKFSIFGRDHQLDFIDYFRSESRYIRILQTVHFILMFNVTVLYFLPTIKNEIYSDEILDLPVVGYFPFNVKHSLGHYVALVLQACFFFLFNLKMIVIDYFMMGIIALHTSQMRYLCDILKIIIKTHLENPLMKESYYFLQLWKRQHQDTYRALLSLKPMMSGYLIVAYLYVVIHTCIPAFVITSTVSWSLPQKAALFIMLSGSLLVLYLLSSAGDSFSTISEETNKVLYGVHLLNWRAGQITFAMHNWLKPFYLKFSSLFPLCFPTFMAIVRLILTYYMTLNEIQHMKKDVP